MTGENPSCESLLDEERNRVVGYYDGIACDYDRSRFGNSYGKFIDSQERKILDKWTVGIPKETILDFGCGTGRLLDYADNGLDPSAGMVSIAKEKHPNKNVRVGTTENLKQSPNQFDAILCFHVFMHISQSTIKDILEASWTSLKPGGFLLCDAPSELRRTFLGHKATGWHGATSISKAGLQQIMETRWTLTEMTGVLFFPLHRIPKILRSFLLPIDNIMCRCVLKEYSSYVIYKLQKKNEITS